MEAMAFKVARIREEEQKKLERKERLKGHRGLRGMKPGDRVQGAK